MHNFLHVIGFSELKSKKEIDQVIEDVLKNWDEKKVVEDEEGRYFTEISKEYGNGFGITVCGEFDETDTFQMEYYYPYYRGENVSVYEDIIVERHAGKESFAGACDDVRMGVTLIFYLLNAAEYLEKQRRGELKDMRTGVSFSGLAASGKILLPVKKNEEQKEEDRKTEVQRNRLIAAARNGDQEAMESLTIEDMDTYSMITKRIQKEDVFSIVDTYFMPYGVECDQYYLLGEILECKKSINPRTGEKVFQLNLQCNDILIDVCVNEKDLWGEPAVGRRFRGAVWLQGTIHF